MTDIAPIPSLSRTDILLLSATERLPYVEQVRVLYPRWKHILDEIKSCHQEQVYAAEPPCMLLVGPTGAGKSTLIGSYVQQYPRVITERSIQVPVLNATIPAKASEKSLLITLLHALGDPKATKGTMTGMTLRLEEFIRDCGVQLFILDELQHFVDQENQKILLNVSNWLKTLIKKTKVACVLVGLEGQAEQVVNTNLQLARLFGDPHLLAPFTWNEAKPDTIQEFRTFLSHLEAMLPLREASRLATRERAWRCFVACDGVTAYLMALIREATKDALRTGRESLDDVLLARAFAKRLAGERREIPNPFVGDPPLSKQSGAATIVNQDGLPAAGNRGKKRKERQLTVQDITRK